MRKRKPKDGYEGIIFFSFCCGWVLPPIWLITLWACYKQFRKENKKISLRDLFNKKF